MKMKNKFMLIGISALGLVSLASCGDEKNDENEYVIENLEYREIGSDDSTNKSASQGEIPNKYYIIEYKTPLLKYINNEEKLNFEIYPGFSKYLINYIEEDINSENFYFDSEQEITLNVYRGIQWYSNGYVSNEKRKDQITKKIYESKKTLGYFMSENFDRSLKNIKCVDEVSISDLYENYYESDDEYCIAFSDEDNTIKRVYDVRSYCVVWYWFEFSCSNGDYIKYYYSGIQNLYNQSFSDGYNPINIRKKYDEIDKIVFSGLGVYLEIIDDKIKTYWMVDGVRHYY